MRRLRCLLVLAVLSAGTLLLASGAAAQEVQEITLRGFVTDASSGQPLIGANVLLLSDLRGDSLRQVGGSATDVNGLYQITGISPGRYVLRVSYIGFAPHLDTLQLGRQSFVTLSVALEPVETPLEEVTVEAQGGVAVLEAGLQRIRPVDLKRIPTPGPGGDLAMYLTSLPGVVSLGDRGGQLFIRGGKPSHNQILVDGTLIYRPFHIISFFSAFPQEIISSVDFYAGGFPAKYGERISAVIDVRTRSGNNREYVGALALGPFLTSVRVEGPIAKGKSSFLALFRTSIIDRTAPVVAGQEVPLKFSDQFVKVQNMSASGRCSVTGMHTYDRGKIDFTSDDVFKWQNYVLAGHCLTFAPRAALTAEVDAGVSYFKNTVGGFGDEDEVTDIRRSNIWRLHTTVDLSYTTGRTEINGGFRVRARGLNYHLQELFQGTGTAEEDFLITVGGYAGAAVRLGNVQLNPSLSAWVPFGEGSIGLQPRLRFSWQPWGTEAYELNGAVGVYRQLFDAISDERDAGSAFKTWLVSPLGNGRPTALHGILGWTQELTSHFNFSIEGYYKDLSNIPVPIWSTSAAFTITLDQATGTVYGLDARIAYEQGPFYGYLGYGYASVEYCLEGENFGAYFGNPVQCYTPPHDRRHSLSAVGSVDFGKWQASVRWQYGSGRPYTPPIGFDAWFDLRTLPNVRRQIGSPRFLFTRPYGARLPAYHRLDVSVGRAFDLDVATLTLEAGAINLYNRNNIFYFDLFTLRRVDQLPLIPYLSIQIETN